ncbi:hypothetical protein HanXRQr2_Chr01g0006701 [Helianthus annuus]|uniref:Uncharacterized protein n=1 Tax=Helianthus annuus TaxID=4232 RepID=A0A9K3JTQ4_HELAN|nr:hypothetical protein HanXRQr2_Chr01g0006701 [Helianthus annuus]KAJ0621325.1 hypothetical protein HanIR_Chr01g0007391 [Helianthus annuus]
MTRTLCFPKQGGESDGQFVQDIEWGSQGVEYMNTLRNQIASQLWSNGSN